MKLIYSNDRDKHITYSDTLLLTMREHQLYANSKRCEFWLEQVVFLGHIVLEDGIKVKLEGENNFKVAKTNR